MIGISFAVSFRFLTFAKLQIPFSRGIAKNAKNLHISASQASGKKAREHLPLETLMQEEFGSLDRKYEKTRGPGGRYGFKEAEHKTNGKRK